MNARRKLFTSTAAAGLIWLLPGIAAAEEPAPACDTPVSSDPAPGDGSGSGGSDGGGSEPKPGDEGSTGGGTTEPAPAPDEPPADEPAPDEPPAEEPPAEEPPAEEPPAEEPPADEPPADTPPTGDDCLAYTTGAGEAPTNELPEGAVQKNLDAKGPVVLGERAVDAPAALPYTGASDVLVLAVVGAGLIALGFGAQRAGATSIAVVRLGRHRA